MSHPVGTVLKPFVARFWAKVQEAPSGCWNWTGSTSGRFGYGHIRTSKRNTENCHRISWMMANGDIPDGFCVLHRCDNPSCVNPAHLFLGTYLDNNRDMAAKGRHWCHSKTHCKHGHEFSPGNTFTQSGGGRGCIACRRKRWVEKGKFERQEKHRLARAAS